MTIERLMDSRQEFLAFLERRVGSKAIAEDLLQKAFVRSMNAELRNDETAVAWFYRVLRNAVIDYYRRNASAERRLDQLADELERPTEEVSRAVCKCVGQLADTLKPEYSEVLKQVEIEGVTVKDYAARAGISSSNAGVRVFRARDALLKVVKQTCGACAEHGCIDCHCQG